MPRAISRIRTTISMSSASGGIFAGVRGRSGSRAVGLFRIGEKSRQQWPDHASVDIREAELPALETVGQLLVIDAEQVQDGGLEVMHMHRVFYRVEGKLVRFAVAEARLHARARHPHRKGVGM